MALDTTGITLAEIRRMFPPDFQPIGYDFAFGTDTMGRPKVLSSFQIGVNAVLTLLFMKPGQFPSIPDLGIDIDSYLHEYSDDPNIPIEIQNKLVEQCNRLDVIGLTINVSLEHMDDNKDALLVEISGTESLSYGNETDHVIIGISYDKLNRLYVKKVNL